jgi:myo-inositol-1(or 4)-monophosphatase
MSVSPNLNIIKKSIDKISSYLGRDFGEIENLQKNAISAIRFSESCYRKICDILVDDLIKMKPDYNIEISDGKKINKDSKYTYLVSPIDGLYNLSRSIPYFTTTIALKYTDNDKSEIISMAAGNVALNELYYCDKGSGSFLNNRRIRVSGRKSPDQLSCSISDISILKNPVISNFIAEKNVVTSIRGSNTLDICYLSCGRIDMSIFSKSDIGIESAILLAKESGAIVIYKNDLIIMTNGSIVIDL